ncbi:MAG: dienelactone hydrolase [Kangiellaceae bacterium]|nr:dienelactone hydrolase [Kangiellaceae bacterium]
MKTKKFVLLIGLLFSIYANASGNRIDGLRPDAPELAAPGPLAIGVRTLQLLNKNQVDILKVVDDKSRPKYDRPLTVEVWYPSDGIKHGGKYEDVLLRDGKTKITLHGQAVRDALPVATNKAYPLVIISHGYPGNRYLMSHLGENLASKGYVAVAIDHTDSRYHDLGTIGSTLVNRPLDQKFVLDEIDRLSKLPSNFLFGKVDTSRTGLIGYSMGAYGAVITSGAGITKASSQSPLGAPGGSLSPMVAGSSEHKAMLDSRFKAIVSIAPWGMQVGVWDAAGLSGIKVPTFFIAGSQDDVSGYKNGTQAIFKHAVNADRYLLTFMNANHNAAAPIPAPDESLVPVEGSSVNSFEHYSDPVWDTLRMNNITQHFVTAYFGQQLLGDKNMNAYLDLVENSQKGVFAVTKNNELKPEHTYWKGFQARTAKGLKLEYLNKQ